VFILPATKEQDDAFVAAFNKTAGFQLGFEVAIKFCSK
jgi:hypothetical protein